jgi:hypothetical protein
VRQPETLRAWHDRLSPEQRKELRQWQRSHRWHPHQIRHAAGTKWRARYGPDVALTNRPPYALAAQQLRRNDGQWRAYQSDGHAVILAGPGGGKTKTLTIKMARILAEDVRRPQA